MDCSNGVDGMLNDVFSNAHGPASGPSQRPRSSSSSAWWPSPRSRSLQSRSTASRDAQLKLATVKLELSKLQTAPFQAHASTGGSPVKARRLITANKSKIEATLATLDRDTPPAQLRQIRGPLRVNYAAVDAIYALGASEVGYGREADQLGTKARQAAGATTGLLDAASREYDRRASRAQLQATVGSVGPDRRPAGRLRLPLHGARRERAAWRSGSSRRTSACSVSARRRRSTTR